MTEFEKKMISELTDENGNFISQKINERYLTKMGIFSVDKTIIKNNRK